MRRPRLHWTPRAAACTAAGLVMVGAGAALQGMHLVVLGGALLLQVAAEAVQAGGRRPRILLEHVIERVPEESEVPVRLAGSGFDVRHQVEVEVSPGLRLHAGSSNVWDPARADDRHEFHLIAKVRGPQRIGPVTLRHWSPLRLWAADTLASHQATLEVVPRPAPNKRFGILSRVVKPMQGRFQVNRPGHGFDFFTLRQYTAGDTMRSVNWKASARREDLIVNQRQLETHSEVLILLDARTVMGLGPAGSTPLDRGCRAALGLFASATTARDTVRFRAYGQGMIGVPDAGGDRIQAVEGLLARLEAAGDTPGGKAWEEARQAMRSHGPVIWITSGELGFDLPHVAADVLARGHPLTVLSPTPTDKDWQASPARRHARKHILDGIRQAGAVVVDWGADQVEAAAEKPVFGVMAP